MTAAELGSIAGVILSAIFEYFPKVSEWYNDRPDNEQKLILLGGMLLVAAGLFLLSCAGLSDKVVCSEQGAWDLIKIFVSGVFASQATYLVLPKK